MGRLAGIFIMLFLMVCSCTTTRTVEVSIETIITKHPTDIVYDSIYVKDSINKWIYEDTVYLYNEHTLYRYRDKVSSLTPDTVTRVVKRETVKEVHLNSQEWLQKTIVWLGGILSLFGIMQ